MKFIITGHAQHGKNTVCEIMSEILGYTSISSSWFAISRTSIFDDFCVRHNLTKQEAYDIRAQHRQEFFNLIKAYNDTNGLDALGKGIFAEYDIYNGIRNVEELDELKKNKLFDYSIWVDASDRKPVEQGSCTICAKDCNIILDNNGTLDDLRISIIDVYTTIAGRK